MEQTTPTISPVSIKTAKPTVKIDWVDQHPYVEVWDGDHLVLAGWVYDSQNYVEPPKEPTVQDYWEKHARDNNITLTTESPFGPVQAGIVTPLHVVPEPCLDIDTTGRTFLGIGAND